jgi:hypothetical protein
MAVHRSPARYLLASLALVTACSAAEPLDLGASAGELIHGTREPGMPSVVLVLQTGATTGGGGLCTGTVIGPYAVLTAKHCVFTETGTGYTALPSVEFLVVVGSDLNDRASIVDTFGVVDVRTTPGSAIDTDINNGDDLAVLLLTRNIGTPAYALAPSVPPPGSSVTVVGYGRVRTGTPDPTDSGVKYRAAMNVSRSGTALIETDGPAWTCQGDSGGPLFDSSMRVAGVTSFGLGATCTNSYSYFTATPRHSALLASALAYAPPCTPVTEMCNGVDDDCDGIVDEGCLGLGDACVRDDQCGGGVCRPIDGSNVCTRDCDPRTAIPRCPYGFYCRETGCGTGECVGGNPGALADGDPCATDLECSSSRCASVAGMTRCGRSCAPAAEACPTGEVCDTSVGGAECGTCLPFALSTAPRPFGAPCDTAAQCADGRCATPGNFCTRACDATTACGGGFHCRAAECVRGDLGGQGSSCTTAEDCSATAPECVDAQGDRLCVAACDAEGLCAAGFVCGSSDAGMRCIPPGAPLGDPCVDSPECRSGICGGGICTRVCDDATPCPSAFNCEPAGAVSGCFPAAPRAPRSRGSCAIAPPDADSARHRGAVALLAAAFLGAVARLRRRRPR